MHTIPQRDASQVMPMLSDGASKIPHDSAATQEQILARLEAIWKAEADRWNHTGGPAL